MRKYNKENELYRRVQARMRTRPVQKVLGIDPGTHSCGLAIGTKYTAPYGKTYWSIKTVLLTATGEHLITRLYKLGGQVKAMVKFFKPDEIVIETYYTRPGHDPGAVPAIRGIILAECFKQARIPIEMNTLTARKLALGKGYRDKMEAHHELAKINTVELLTLDTMSADEKDAVILCLAGIVQKGTPVCGSGKKQRKS